ncbi:amidohydrolase family protein [Allokutzneria sp. NRRL B-24872]|uniref:amidohydrolase family protein n=1 Tax=Allokutzneria sp. NRRL B-24872 TaxID=1137961 RepID=UPI000A392256|nr:amidohydrolase family protein [Allokutzneria sp. NRRL B-24872]
MTEEFSLLLRGVRLADGRTVDVGLRGGEIAEVGPAGSLTGWPEVLDLSGYLLLPAPAEPHAHLDKALTTERVENPAGDLVTAIELWRGFSPSMEHEDIVRRATEAALMSLASGATAIRTHVDVGGVAGLRCLKALLEVREAVRHRLDLQLVAFVDVPLSGEAGAENRALMRTSVQMGADAVGAFPYADPNPEECHRVCLAIADEFGVPVDLHTDETTDPDVLYLEHYARLVTETGFAHGAAASHCVSLGMQPPEIAARVAESVAAAGISVICLPQTNLGLQSREHTGAPARGLTALRELLAAGVTVAGGGDNVQDPFNPIGRGDPLEAAALLVSAGHLSPRAAYDAVSSGARAAMGLPEVQVRQGFPAELLAIRATGVADAVARASADRVVIHRGHVVSRTTVTHELPPLPGESA